MSQEVDFYFTMIGFGLARKRTVSGYSGYTILVVDDQEETLISTQLLLQKEGHQVLTSASGEEAMTLFCPGKVALILVDYFRPGPPAISSRACAGNNSLMRSVRLSGSKQRRSRFCSAKRRCPLTSRPRRSPEV